MQERVIPLPLLPPHLGHWGLTPGQVNSPSLTGHPCDPLKRGTLKASCAPPPPLKVGRAAGQMDLVGFGD